MSFVTTPTIYDVMTDIIAFLTAALPAGTPIQRGLSNRVPAPLPEPGFAIVTPIYQERLNFNVDTYATSPFPNSQTYQQSVRADIQCDLYGRFSSGWAATVATLWRDEYACNLLKNSQPLYADEARMIPLVDSELQYEERWSLVLSAQYNPVTTVAQGFADALDIDLVDVNEAYPP